MSTTALQRSSHRVSSAMVTILLSIAAGVVAGTVTVHNLSPRSYGPADAIVRDSVAASSPSLAAESCDDCSERDLGYHWASLQQLRSIADCPDGSWDFRRGCVAYMRDTGGL